MKIIYFTFFISFVCFVIFCQNGFFTTFYPGAALNLFFSGQFNVQWGVSVIHKQTKCRFAEKKAISRETMAMSHDFNELKSAEGSRYNDVCCLRGGSDNLFS